MADGPLALALAVAVLAIAFFCSGRLVLGLCWRCPLERDVDVVHVVMGVSMAGMLTGWLAGSWTAVWMVAFSASSVWFAWCVRRDLAHGARAPGSGHLPHLVASVAMLYMLVAMRWLSPGAAAHGMTGMSTAGGGTPVLGVTVAALLVLDASISASRLFLPSGVDACGAVAAAVTGGHAGTIGASGASGIAVAGRRAAGTACRPLAPRGTAACTLVMSLAMAYMFVTVHP